MVARRTILLLVGGVAAGSWGAFRLMTPTEVEFTRAGPEAPQHFELRPGVSTVHVELPVDLSGIAQRMDAALSERLAMGLDLADPTCARKPATGDCASARSQATVAKAGPATATLGSGTVRIRLPLRIEPSSTSEAIPVETSVSFAFQVRGGGPVPIEIVRVSESTQETAPAGQHRLIRLVEARLRPLSLTAEDELRTVLAALPVTTATQYAWNKLAQGIPLEDGTETRLVATPEVAGAGELVSGSSRTLYRIPIATRLSLETGSPDTRTRRRAVVNGQVMTTGRAAIRLATPVALAHLQPAIDAAFVHAGPFETQADRFGPPVKVEISRARIYPAANMLALQLNLSASRFAGQVYRGTAHLVGRPVLDAERRLVTLADIGFPQTAPSDARRSGAPASAPRLAADPFASKLGSVVRLDISSNLAEAQPRASRLLNRRIDDRLTLSANLDAAQPVAFEVSSSGGWLVSEVAGSLTLTYDAGTVAALPAPRIEPASATLAQPANARQTLPEATTAAVVTSAGISARQADKSLTGTSPPAGIATKPVPVAAEGDIDEEATRKPVPRKSTSSRPGQSKQDAREASAKSAGGRTNWVPFPTNN